MINEADYSIPPVGALEELFTGESEEITQGKVWDFFLSDLWILAGWIFAATIGIGLGYIVGKLIGIIINHVVQFDIECALFTYGPSERCN